jgi:hypothetical protein
MLRNLKTIVNIFCIGSRPFKRLLRATVNLTWVRDSECVKEGKGCSTSWIQEGPV